MTTTDMGQKTDKVSNIVSHLRFKLGEPAQGFGEADVVIEREFNTATVHQGYIEPHNATALVERRWPPVYLDEHAGRLCGAAADGRSAGLAGVARVGHPVRNRRWFWWQNFGLPGTRGGLLSRKAGQPVKLIMSRIEEFEGTGPTPASHIKVKMGAKKDGSIVAAEAQLMYEAGAFPGSPVGAGAMCIFSPYAIPNMQVDGYDVVVNKPKTAAYRAPGATNAAFASETIIDELAEKIGMDPLEIRRINGAKEGDRRVDGPTFPRIGYLETVHAAIEHEHYATPLSGPNRGRGVASGFWFNVGFQSTVVINVNADGTVSLVEGSTDIGGTRASIAMQAAETLGVPYEDVRPTVVGTDGIGFTDVTGGSRTTFATGYAAYEASLDVLRQMKERLARRWSSELEASNTTRDP